MSIATLPTVPRHNRPKHHNLTYSRIRGARIRPRRRAVIFLTLKLVAVLNGAQL